MMIGAAELAIDHTVLAANTAPSAPDTTGPLQFNWSAVGDTSGVPLSGLSGDSIHSDDPLLGPLSDNGGQTRTHLPEPGSPLIDAGNPLFTAPSSDQRSQERPVGIADIGAVEVQPVDHPVDPGDDPETSDEPGVTQDHGGEDDHTERIWIPVAPSRLVDTRVDAVTVDGSDQGGGWLAPRSQQRIEVAGRGDVPADAAGVVAYVTAVQAHDTGYLTVHPCAEPMRLAASLNYTERINVGNEVIIGLDDGDVCIFTSSATHLTVDVVGYIPAASSYETLEPARLLDTRPTGETVDGEFAGIEAPGAGRELRIPIAGRGGVPADVRGAVLYVTAVQGDDAGYVTVWDCDAPRPLASSLNHVAGVNRGNEIVATLGSDGDICLFTSGDVELTVDVAGYLATTGAGYAPTAAPSRILDTRTGGETIDGRFAGDGAATAGSIVELEVAGRAGVPDGADTVTLNLTAARPTAIGYVTAYPCGGAPPLAANLNYVPFVNGANEIIVSLDADGSVCLFTSSDVHLTADVTGSTTPAS